MPKIIPQVGQLVYALYDVHPNKHYLIIYLGSDEIHVYGILADNVTDHEIAILKAKNAELQKVNLKDMRQYLVKLKCFGALSGYRSFMKQPFKIEWAKDPK